MTSLLIFHGFLVLECTPVFHSRFNFFCWKSGISPWCKHFLSISPFFLLFSSIFLHYPSFSSLFLFLPFPFSSIYSLLDPVIFLSPSWFQVFILILKCYLCIYKILLSMLLQSIVELSQNLKFCWFFPLLFFTSIVLLCL